MPNKPYFFTDPSNLNTQTQAYGPVAGSETTQYLVTSKLQFSTASDAIAVCSGTVFIQEHQSDSSLINLVLIPTESIANGFTPVKYFVYRGLQKNNILDSSDDFLGQSDGNASDLVKDIWTQFNSLKALDSSITAPKPNNVIVGWDKNVNPGTDQLDTILNVNDNDFQLAPIQAGKTLAKFDTSQGGFEIVLLDKFVTPTLDYVRASDHRITVSAPGGGDIPGNEPIAKMRQRENVLNFIDPASWYMMFFEKGVTYGSSPDTATGFDEIYNNLLQTFATKNTLYLDIRNENGYSLNYYRDNEGESSDSDYGDHIQISWDGSSFTPTNYYSNYWPILPLTPPSNSSSEFNQLSIKFRKLYNPEPLIYADYAQNFLNGSFRVLSGSEKFKQESSDNSSNSWSEAYQFQSPNLPNLPGLTTQVAAIVFLMNVRQSNPSIALPDTVPVKNHFLDNTFGPVGYVPDIAGANVTQWISGLGKKFIDSSSKNGMQGIFETGIGVSQEEVILFANIIEEHTPVPSSSEINIETPNKPEPAGKSTNPSIISEVKQAWYRDRGFELQKQELAGSVFYIMLNKSLNPPISRSGNIQLTMRRSEYDALTLSTSIDESLHEPLLTFSFSNQSDMNGVDYLESPLNLVGLTNTGQTDTDSLSLSVLTFNYEHLNTRSAGDQATVKRARNGVLSINTFIDTLKTAEDIYDDSPVDMSTRLRVHYYGQFRDVVSESSIWDYGKGIIFDNTLPLADYTSGLVPRKLDRVRFLFREEDYDLLTSHADENGVKGNPSPYLSDGNYEIDLGQVLYGFETLFFQPHEPTSELFPPASNTYSPSYLNFPVLIVNDLAGWPANVATAVTEFFLHVRDNEPANSAYPDGQPPNLLTYYQISAPEADILGNIDAVGILRAFQVLAENPSNENLQLSDVFTLYYKGASNLRPGLALLPNPTHKMYTVADRWKIFCLFFGFMKEDANNNFIWLPDTSDWGAVKGPNSSSSMGRDYDSRLFSFTEFWLTTKTNFFWAGIRLYYNYVIPESDIERFSTINNNFNGSGLSEAQWVKAQIDICFENYFLGYLKNKAI